MIYLLVPNPPKQKSTYNHISKRGVPNGGQSRAKKKKSKKKEKGEFSSSLRDIEKCHVRAGLVRNEHVLSLENIPSVEKNEEGRYKYSREEGRREMVAAVGGSSERVWQKKNFFTSFFCVV